MLIVISSKARDILFNRVEKPGRFLSLAQGPGLIDQHDGNIIPDFIKQLTVVTDQSVPGFV